jgi:hypothetical protein
VYLKSKENIELKKAYNNLSKQLTKLRRLRNEFWGLEGYFPDRRPVGPLYIAVLRFSTEVDESGNPVLYKSGPQKGQQKKVREAVWSSSAQNEAHLEAIKKYVETDLTRDFALKDTATQQFKIVYGEAKTLQDSSYFMVGDLNTERIVENAIAQLQKQGKITTDIATNLSNQVLQSIADSMRARGASSSGIARNVLKWEKFSTTQGYIKTGMKSVINSYVLGFHGLQTKITASLEFLKILKNVTNPQEYEDLSLFARDMLRNLDKYDRQVGSLKGLSYNYYIWGRWSAVLLQASQNLVMGAPILAAEMRIIGFNKRGWNGLLGAERYLTNAMKKISLPQHYKLTPEQKELLDDLEKHNVTMPQLAQDLGVESSDPSTRPLKRLFNAIGQPFATMETINRKIGALAMFDMLLDAQKAGKVNMTKDQMYAQVGEFIDAAHGWFGRGSTPALARMPGLAGHAMNLFYTFGRFWHNYALALWYSFQNYGGIGGTLMIARSFAWIVALAGVPALPFVDDFMEIVERAVGIPIRKEAKMAVKQYFGSTTQQFYSAGMLSFVLGDMAASIKPLRMPGVSGTWGESIVGVYGGMYDKASKAVDAYRISDYEKVLQNISPSAIEAIMKGYTSLNRGYRDTQNRIIYDENGNPLRPTKTEAIKIGLGFKQYNSSQIMEERRSLQNIEQAWRAKRERLQKELRIANTDSEKLKVYNKMADYSMSIPKELIGIIPYARPQIDIPKPKWLRFTAEPL